MDALSEIRTALADDLREMNELISCYLHSDHRLMGDVVDRYLLTKGKQIRPILVLLSARMFGGVNRHVLHAGAALEMLHNATLIHDDVVDDTTVRRGRDTVNAIWGNHIAVLVGDFFVSNALAAGIKTGRISIISALSELGRELSLGEIDQICNARDHTLSEENYIEIIRQKTASLFMNCVKMGAEAVDAPADAYAPMVRYAELLGLCFQMKDDIFDYFESKEVGKPTGNDLRENKVSLPLIHAISVAPPEEAAGMKDLLQKESLNETEIQELIEFAKSHGGIDYTYSRMREMQEEGEEIIRGIPDSEWKRHFSNLFEYIISRNH